jgi:hypothetical protein
MSRTTTIPLVPSIRPDDPARRGASQDPVEAFPNAVRSGEGVPAGLHEPDAMLDATVRNGDVEDVVREPIAGGELGVYRLTGAEAGVPHAAHHCHVLRIRTTGRIAADTVLCGGRWPAALPAEIGAAW